MSKEIEGHVPALFDELLSAPFGSLSKPELENLLFKHMLNEGIITYSEGVFPLSMRLQITLTKARNLIYTYEQRELSRELHQSDLNSVGLPTSLEAIMSETKFEIRDANHISFGIENPFQKTLLEYLVRRAGYFSDGSFSSEIVVLGNHAFVALLSQFEVFSDSKTKANLYRTMTKDELKTLQSKTEKILSATPNLIGAAAELVGYGNLYALASSLYVQLRKFAS
jgi:hypothetical protein